MEARESRTPCLSTIVLNDGETINLWIIDETYCDYIRACKQVPFNNSCMPFICACNDPIGCSKTTITHS